MSQTSSFRFMTIGETKCFLAERNVARGAFCCLQFPNGRSRYPYAYLEALKLHGVNPVLRRKLLGFNGSLYCRRLFDGLYTKWLDDIAHFADASGCPGCIRTVDAARLLCVTTATVRNWRDNRTLNFEEQDGAFFVKKESLLEAFEWRLPLKP